ncbi:hypothetical protein [Streptomyces sp. NPDC048527]|uniref:hypothetical protein n=1 Tax=Streptomyces sp. NPDC048527 TaxID=3365568 RepID=UPI0037171538
MRRTLRYLLLATQTGLAAVSATAVYGAPAAVYADAVIGLCWLIAAALLLRRRRPPDPPGDDTPALVTTKPCGIPPMVNLSPAHTGTTATATDRAKLLVHRTPSARALRPWPVTTPAEERCVTKVPKPHVSSAVMTHPVRLVQAQHLAARLRLDGLAVDPDPQGPPSALRTALVAWSAAAPGASHHLVVQDDVDAPAELLEIVTRAAARFPDEALVFYADGRST